MTTTKLLSRLMRPARRLFRPLGYFLAFLLPPLIVAAATTTVKLAPAGTPPAFSQPLPDAPTHDGSRLTAVILAGNLGAESIDLLAPYEVLAASGAFNVYVAAPERELLPLFPGSPHLAGVDIIPHYSFSEYDRLIGTNPDLMVVPFIPSTRSAEDALVLSWMRERMGPRTTLLTICGGSWTAAQAGLLTGRSATTHQNVFPTVETAHPDVRWVRDQRWIEDGNVISSAGITAGIDATLHALDRLVGREAAEATARELGYPHAHFLDDPSYVVPVPNMSAPGFSLAFRWENTDIGLVLYEGVSEIELASIADTYPRSFSTSIHSVGVERRIINSRHGLAMVPRYDFASAPTLDRVLVPGKGPSGELAAEVAAWTISRRLRAEYVHRSAVGQFAFDAALRDQARQDTLALAVETATGIEYPTNHLTLEGTTWPYELPIRALALGLLGVGTIVGLGRIRRARRAAITHRL